MAAAQAAVDERAESVAQAQMVRDATLRATGRYVPVESPVPDTAKEGTGAPPRGLVTPPRPGGGEGGPDEDEEAATRAALLAEIEALTLEG